MTLPSLYYIYVGMEQELNIPYLDVLVAYDRKLTENSLSWIQTGNELALDWFIEGRIV